jgi:sugar lactone lactonase YvrE
LPADKRPRQIPIIRAEESGDVILASYHKLTPLGKLRDASATRTLDAKNVVTPAISAVHNSLVKKTLSTPSFLKKGREKYRLTIPILVAVAVSIIVFVLVLVLVLHPIGPMFIKPQPPPANHYSLSVFWIYLTGNQYCCFYNSFPDRIAVDSGGGNVYVAENGNNRIQKFDSTGHFITKWGSKGSSDGHFEDPGSVAVDHSGNVYVADAQIDRVQKFDSTGYFITKWGTFGSPNGQFNGPDGVAVDSGGNVYVADGNNRIQKFDSTGHFITKWGSNGTVNEQFQSISSIAVDSTGKVYVADLGKDSFIHVFTPT